MKGASEDSRKQSSRESNTGPWALVGIGSYRSFVSVGRKAEQLCASSPGCSELRRLSLALLWSGARSLSFLFQQCRHAVPETPMEIQRSLHCCVRAFARACSQAEEGTLGTHEDLLQCDLHAVPSVLKAESQVTPAQPCSLHVLKQLL